MSSYLEDRIESAEDRELIVSLDADQAKAFSDWLERLDKHHAEVGAPYGDGSLIRITGAGCWWDYFYNEYEPAEALEEDMSNAY